MFSQCDDGELARSVTPVLSPEARLSVERHDAGAGDAETGLQADVRQIGQGAGGFMHFGQSQQIPEADAEILALTIPAEGVRRPPGRIRRPAHPLEKLLKHFFFFGPPPEGGGPQKPFEAIRVPDNRVAQKLAPAGQGEEDGALLIRPAQGGEEGVRIFPGFEDALKICERALGLERFAEGAEELGEKIGVSPREGGVEREGLKVSGGLGEIAHAQGFEQACRRRGGRAAGEEPLEGSESWMFKNLGGQRNLPMSSGGGRPLPGLGGGHLIHPVGGGQVGHQNEKWKKKNGNRRIEEKRLVGSVQVGEETHQDGPQGGEDLVAREHQSHHASAEVRR